MKNKSYTLEGQVFSGQ